MKKILYFFFVAFITFFYFSCINKEEKYNQTQKDEINGQLETKSNPREYFFCPNWDDYLSNYSNTLLFFDKFNNSNLITNLKVYEGETKTSKKQIYEAIWDNGKIITEIFTPIYGDKYYTNYEYDEKNRLIHKYNMYSENDIPEKDDFSYEYTYNPETDELLCKKTNKLGDSYEYRETITNFGYTITEKYITNVPLSSYSQTINLSFNDNMLSKYEIISKNGNYSYIYNTEAGMKELYSYIDGKLISKEIETNEGYNKKITKYRIINNTENIISETIFSDFDSYENWQIKKTVDTNSIEIREFIYSEKSK